MSTIEYSDNIRNEYCVETAARRPLRRPVVVALSIRIRDMGNGVDRIEDASRIPFDEAIAGADGLGCEPLPQPTPARIKDAVVTALGAIGVTAPTFPEMLIEGYSKVATDRAIDFVAWMALFV
jgi:hypothetical protein